MQQVQHTDKFMKMFQNQTPMEAIAQVIATRTAMKADFALHRRGGDIVYLESSIAPAFDEQDRVTHVIIVHTDVTAHVLASRQLEYARLKALESTKVHSDM